MIYIQLKSMILQLLHTGLSCASQSHADISKLKGKVLK